MATFQEEYTNAFQTLRRWFQSGAPDEMELFIFVLGKSWSPIFPGIPGELAIRLIANELAYEDGTLKSGTINAAVAFIKQVAETTAWALPGMSY